MQINHFQKIYVEGKIYIEKDQYTRLSISHYIKMSSLNAFYSKTILNHVYIAIAARFLIYGYIITPQARSYTKCILKIFLKILAFDEVSTSTEWL